MVGGAGVGLEAVTWDWETDDFGSAVHDFPRSRVSHLIGPNGALGCHPVAGGNVSFHEKGEGDGAMVETWFRTGHPPTGVE